jgi:hypothetical protein
MSQPIPLVTTKIRELDPAVWSDLRTTEDNRFTPHKPNQGQLFGVRDVTRSASLRDA